MAQYNTQSIRGLRGPLRGSTQRFDGSPRCLNPIGFTHYPRGNAFRGMVLPVIYQQLHRPASAALPVTQSLQAVRQSSQHPHRPASAARPVTQLLQPVRQSLQPVIPLIQSVGQSFQHLRRPASMTRQSDSRFG
eukprot:1194471-Prorocentrum_minimum.AAC.2